MCECECEWWVVGGGWGGGQSSVIRGVREGRVSPGDNTTDNIYCCVG